MSVQSQYRYAGNINNEEARFAAMEAGLALPDYLLLNAQGVAETVAEAVLSGTDFPPSRSPSPELLLPQLQPERVELMTLPQHPAYQPAMATPMTPFHPHPPHYPNIVILVPTTHNYYGPLVYCQPPSYQPPLAAPPIPYTPPAPPLVPQLEAASAANALPRQYPVRPPLRRVGPNVPSAPRLSNLGPISSSIETFYWRNAQEKMIRQNTRKYGPQWRKPPAEDGEAAARKKKDQFCSTVNCQNEGCEYAHSFAEVLKNRIEHRIVWNESFRKSMCAFETSEGKCPYQFCCNYAHKRIEIMWSEDYRRNKSFQNYRISVENMWKNALQQLN